MRVSYIQELSYWTAQGLGRYLSIDPEFANELVQVLATRGGSETQEQQRNERIRPT